MVERQQKHTPRETIAAPDSTGYSLEQTADTYGVPPEAYDNNRDEWTPLPEGKEIVYTPDGIAYLRSEVDKAYGGSFIEMVPAADGYGFVPAQNTRPENTDPVTGQDKLNTAAIARNITMVGAGITTLTVAGVPQKSIEMAQQIYEQSPTLAAQTLGFTALSVILTTAAVKGWRKKLKERSTNSPEQ